MSNSPENEIRILVVDDNPDLLAAVSLALETMGGFSVISAANGIEGLEQFFIERPDCMVIDVKMPGLDGYQLVKSIRGDPASAATPLVILTALAQDRDRFTGLATGADQYLIKPVKPQELVGAIHRAISVSAADRKRRLEAFVDEVTGNDAGGER